MRHDESDALAREDRVQKGFEVETHGGKAQHKWLHRSVRRVLHEAGKNFVHR